MVKQNSAEEVCDLCLSRGLVIELEQDDKERSRGLFSNASTCLESAKVKPHPLVIFSLNYDALCMYSRALLLFSMKETYEDQCLFAVLCLKNEDLDWNFFERIRALRQCIDKDGKQISHSDWKEVELGFTLTISLLKREIERLLSNS